MAMTKQDAPRVQNRAWPAEARKNSGPEITADRANYGNNYSNISSLTPSFPLT